jgi:hypothetical protein
MVCIMLCHMADYQTLIARAVADLEENTGEARSALYNRALTALFNALRGIVPPLSERYITRERLKLEEAIQRVEAESVRQAEQSEENDPSVQLARLIGQPEEAKQFERNARRRRDEKSKRLEEPPFWQPRRVGP